jgi:hypothetical protein
MMDGSGRRHLPLRHAAPRRRPAPSHRARELQDGIRRVREEALIRAMGGEEWPFQAFFPSGPVQTEQQFQTRTVFNPGRTDPAEMAPGTGHSGKTERTLNRPLDKNFLNMYSIMGTSQQASSSINSPKPKKNINKN